jgi:hypothetical protein
MSVVLAPCRPAKCALLLRAARSRNKLRDQGGCHETKEPVNAVAPGLLSDETTGHVSF